MHKDQLREIAESRMPEVPAVTVPGAYRWNVIDGLPAEGNLGIELGVAAGSFSAMMMGSGRFRRFYGVDVYGDNHDIVEYKTALRTIGLDQPYHLLRMTFEQALDLFPDAHFDFIYVDGYAHTGEEGGRTLHDWYAKLKPGGIFAGDDYDLERWPLVVWAVNHLVAQLQVTLNLTDQVLDLGYNRYQSWFFRKPEQAAAMAPVIDASLMELGEQEKKLRAEARRKRQAMRRQTQR